MAIARHDAVRMTFNGACQHRIVCRANLNHLNLQSAGCNLGFLDEQAEQRLFFVWRKADTDKLVCVQDRANHRRARDARTASSMVASSCFAGILFVRALICSRILKRSSRSR